MIIENKVFTTEFDNQTQDYPLVVKGRHESDGCGVHFPGGDYTVADAAVVADDGDD